MRTIGALLALSLAGCYSSFVVRRIPSQDLGESKEANLGVVYQLTRPELVLKQVPDPADATRRSFQLDVRYVADPTQRFGVAIDRAWWVEHPFNLAFGAAGELTSSRSSTKEKITPTIVAIGRFTAQVLDTVARGLGGAGKTLGTLDQRADPLVKRVGRLRAAFLKRTPAPSVEEKKAWARLMERMSRRASNGEDLALTDLTEAGDLGVLGSGIACLPEVPLDSAADRFELRRKEARAALDAAVNNHPGVASTESLDSARAILDGLHSTLPDAVNRAEGDPKKLAEVATVARGSVDDAQRPVLGDDAYADALVKLKGSIDALEQEARGEPTDEEKDRAYFHALLAHLQENWRVIQSRVIALDLARKRAELSRKRLELPSATPPNRGPLEGEIATLEEESATLERRLLETLDLVAETKRARQLSDYLATRLEKEGGRGHTQGTERVPFALDDYRVAQDELDALNAAIAEKRLRLSTESTRPKLPFALEPAKEKAKEKYEAKELEARPLDSEPGKAVNGTWVMEKLGKAGPKFVIVRDRDPEQPRAEPQQKKKEDK